MNGATADIIEGERVGAVATLVSDRADQPDMPVGSQRKTGQKIRLIEIDGEVVNDVNRPVLMIAVGNGSNVGGGTEVNPDADTEDGLLDVMVSRAVSPMAKLGYVARLRKGEHEERDDVVSFRGRSVKVSGDEFWMSADGEISGPERSRSWRLEPAAYCMILG